MDGLHASYPNRQPEPGTSRGWLDPLESGGSGSDVAIGILSSPESEGDATTAEGCDGG